MFQDEAGFGRINKPKYCWCKKGERPCVPCTIYANIGMYSVFKSHIFQRNQNEKAQI